MAGTTSGWGGGGVACTAECSSGGLCISLPRSGSRPTVAECSGAAVGQVAAVAGGLRASSPTSSSTRASRELIDAANRCGAARGGRRCPPAIFGARGDALSRRGDRRVAAQTRAGPRPRCASSSGRRCRAGWRSHCRHYLDQMSVTLRPVGFAHRAHTARVRRLGTGTRRPTARVSGISAGPRRALQAPTRAERPTSVERRLSHRRTITDRALNAAWHLPGAAARMGDRRRPADAGTLSSRGGRADAR